MPFSLEALEVGRLYTRPQLATLWGYRGYQAFSRGVFTPRGTNRVVLFVTREKQRSLTQYRDFISGDRLYWEGQAAHGSDDRIARAHEYGEQVHLFYRDIHHTPFRYYGQLLIREFRRKPETPSEFVFSLVADLSPYGDLRRHESELSSLVETEREEVRKARVGQGKFRAGLVKFWSGCAVSGVSQPGPVEGLAHQALALQLQLRTIGCRQRPSSATAVRPPL
jgi:hypothetical protein